MSHIPQLYEFGEEFYREHRSRLNEMIGKLTVPAMRGSDPLVKEVHRELLAFAVWFDETFEEKEPYE